MSFWFRRKYNLPPTDPRFLDALPSQIEEDFWAHHYADNPATESGSDEDYDRDSILEAMEAGDWEEVISA